MSGTAECLPSSSKRLEATLPIILILLIIISEETLRLLPSIIFSYILSLVLVGCRSATSRATTWLNSSITENILSIHGIASNRILHHTFEFSVYFERNINSTDIKDHKSAGEDKLNFYRAGYALAHIHLQYIFLLATRNIYSFLSLVKISLDIEAEAYCEE